MVCINPGCGRKQSYSSRNEKTGYKKFRPYCYRCHKLEYTGTKYPEGITRIKTDTCAITKEFLDSSQLELDHKDGDDTNNTVANIWTLSKNMHGLKTKICGDGRVGLPQRTISEACKIAKQLARKTPKQRRYIFAILRGVYY